MIFQLKKKRNRIFWGKQWSIVDDSSSSYLWIVTRWWRIHPRGQVDLPHPIFPQLKNLTISKKKPFLMIHHPFHLFSKKKKWVEKKTICFGGGCSNDTFLDLSYLSIINVFWRRSIWPLDFVVFHLITFSSSCHNYVYIFSITRP